MGRHANVFPGRFMLPRARICPSRMYARGVQGWLDRPDSCRLCPGDLHREPIRAPERAVADPNRLAFGAIDPELGWFWSRRASRRCNHRKLYAQRVHTPDRTAGSCRGFAFPEQPVWPRRPLAARDGAPASFRGRPAAC